MKKLTYTSYILFLFLGYIFTIVGVVSKNMALSFNVTDADIIFAFTFFTVGTTSAIFINGILLEKLSYKQEAVISFLLSLTGITGMVFSKNIFIFTLFLAINGLGIGMLVSLGNHIIITMYEKERVQKLNILNFFYSFGSVAGPIIAGYIVTYCHWGVVYGVGVLFLLLITALILSCSYKLEEHGKENGVESSEKWGKNIYFTAIAIFSYVLSEMIITYWVVAYVMERAGFTQIAGSKVLSVVWAAMTVGRFISGFATAKIEAKRYIQILGIIAAAGLVMILFSKDSSVYIFAAVLGLGYSGLYATILSFGTHQIKGKSTKLMTFFITCGSAGGIVAAPLSGFIRKSIGIDGVITAALIFVIVLLTSITITSKSKEM